MLRTIIGVALISCTCADFLPPIKTAPQESKPALKDVNLLQAQSGGAGELPGVPFPNVKQPSPEGHFLTNSELTPITSVSCLKAKQANPAVICENSTVIIPGGGYQGLIKDINAGNYPYYQDKVCRSNGEYFCDPNGALTSEQALDLGVQLQNLRQSNVVNCGYLVKDPVDPIHYQPFYLGVVIAEKWPTAQSDPESLQQFGQIVAAQWHLDHLYEGANPPYARCPNTAVLVVLPDKNEAFLSSSSCEFICASRGGPEIVTATLVGLSRGGTAEAVREGVETAYKAIANIPGRSSITVGSANAAATVVATNSRKAEPVYNFLLRLLFACAIVLMVISVAIAILVLLISPGVISKRRK